MGLKFLGWNAIATAVGQIFVVFQFTLQCEIADFEVGWHIAPKSVGAVVSLWGIPGSFVVDILRCNIHVVSRRRFSLVGR
jgi:hypothetical protein